MNPNVVIKGGNFTELLDSEVSLCQHRSIHPGIDIRMDKYAIYQKLQCFFKFNNFNPIMPSGNGAWILGKEVEHFQA